MSTTMMTQRKHNNNSSNNSNRIYDTNAMSEQDPVDLNYRQHQTVMGDETEAIQQKKQRHDDDGDNYVNNNSSSNSSSSSSSSHENVRLDGPDSASASEENAPTTIDGDGGDGDYDTPQQQQQQQQQQEEEVVVEERGDGQHHQGNSNIAAEENRQANGESGDRAAAERSRYYYDRQWKARQAIAKEMFANLLDLEQPVITNKMARFFEQDGVLDVFLNFIARNEHFRSPLSSQNDTGEERTGEYGEVLEYDEAMERVESKQDRLLVRQQESAMRAVSRQKKQQDRRMQSNHVMINETSKGTRHHVSAVNNNLHLGKNGEEEQTKNSTAEQRDVPVTDDVSPTEADVIVLEDAFASASAASLSRASDASAQRSDNIDRDKTAHDDADDGGGENGHNAKECEKRIRESHGNNEMAPIAQHDTLDANDMEFRNVKRSYRVMDFLTRSNLSTPLFMSIVESHVPYILYTLITNIFQPGQMRANIFHFMRVLEFFLKSRKGIVFQTIAEYDLLDFMLPYIDNAPVRSCITSMYMASKPLDPQDSMKPKAKVVTERKSRFQKYLGRRNLLLRLLEQVYTNRTEESENMCQSACDLFIDLVDDLSFQQRLSGLERAPAMMLPLVTQDHVDPECQVRYISNASSAFEDSSTYTLSSSSSSSLTYVEALLDAIVDPHATYTCRESCSKILQFLIEKTLTTSKTCNVVNNNTLVGLASAFVNEVNVTMRVIHEHIMVHLKKRFERLCHAIFQGSMVDSLDRAQNESITYPGFTVIRPFTVHRMNLLQSFYHVIRFDFFTASQFSPSCVLQHLQSNNPDIFSVLIDWFFEYPNNNIYHKIFTDVICEVIYYGEEEIWEMLLKQKRLVTRMIKAYETRNQAANKGHIMHTMNLLRLYMDTVEHDSFFYRFLKSHNEWRRFQMKLKMYTLRERKSSDEREIKIGSDFAQELGFSANDLYRKRPTQKQERKILRKRNRAVALENKEMQSIANEKHRARHPWRRRLRRHGDEDEDSGSDTDESEIGGDIDMDSSDEEASIDERQDQHSLSMLNPCEIFPDSNLVMDVDEEDEDVEDVDSGSSDVSENESVSHLEAARSELDALFEDLLR